MLYRPALNSFKLVAQRCRPAYIGRFRHKFLLFNTYTFDRRIQARAYTQRSYTMCNNAGDYTSNQEKSGSPYSKVSIREAEKRLGFRLDEVMVVSVDMMLENAMHGLGNTNSIKDKVYNRIVEYIDIEGYPTEANLDFKETSINHLVYTTISPILSNFRHKVGRNIRLTSEKEIISTDEEITPTDEEITSTDKEITPTDEEITPTDEEITPTDEEITPTDEGVMFTDEETTNEETRDVQEYVVKDRISVTEEKVVVIIEVKRGLVGETMKQCLLAMKDARDNNGGGNVYGFVTTGETWQMISYDGTSFQMTRKIQVLFEGMDQNKGLWMRNCSVLVDCMYAALENGGL